MEMIVGTASEHISFGTDSVVMRIYLLFSWGICFTPLIYSNFVKYITKWFPRQMVSSPAQDRG